MAYPVHLVSAGASTDLEADASVRQEVGAALVMAGYKPTVDGLIRFQRVNGLGPEGLLTPETLDALGVVLR